MALTETTEQQLEIVGNYNHIQIKTTTTTLRDGIPIASANHRKVIGPNDDASGESVEVIDMAAAVHTPAIKAAYDVFLTEQVL